LSGQRRDGNACSGSIGGWILEWTKKSNGKEVEQARRPFAKTKFHDPQNIASRRQAHLTIAYQVSLIPL